MIYDHKICVLAINAQLQSLSCLDMLILFCHITPATFFQTTPVIQYAYQEINLYSCVVNHVISVYMKTIYFLQLSLSNAKKVLFLWNVTSFLILFNGRFVSHSSLVSCYWKPFNSHKHFRVNWSKRNLISYLITNLIQIKN